MGHRYLLLRTVLPSSKNYTVKLRRILRIMSARAATHAGTWYSSRPDILSNELDGWLSQVPDSIDGQNLPIPGARIIIAP